MQLTLPADSPMRAPDFLCGVATSAFQIEGAVHDEARIRYFQSHLDALGAAMAGGVGVAGYFHWSLVDNFEWAEGYTKRFGLEIGRAHV